MPKKTLIKATQKPLGPVVTYGWERVNRHMVLEHVGFSVHDPFETADWYVRNLGFTAVRRGGAPGDVAATVFIRSPNGTVLELIRSPEIPPLSAVTVHPEQLHIAFFTTDPDGDCSRLTEAGAALVSQRTLQPSGDRLLLLHDPWGNSIQLSARAGGPVA